MANDFFDKVVDTTKRAANTVAETTEALIDKGKLKASEIQTKGDIRAEYRKLGELYYESRKNDAENGEKLSLCVEVLDSLKAKLAKIQAEIELAR